MSNDVKQKKSGKEKRVLIGAIGVAAVIVAGSTFAWFTSTDEVTNKLSASGEYGVAITEDFTPPVDWIPGQSVKKEAGAVNTGNVDAFVRMWLTGTMRLVTEKTGTTVTDFETKELGGAELGGLFKYKDAAENSNTYYRQLSESERGIMQTSELVYAEDKFTYTVEKTGEEKTLTSFTDGNGAVKIVDSKSFEPQGEGLYIFRRNTSGDTEYSGYYCKKIGDEIICFALVDNTSIVGDDQIKNVYIKGLSNKSGTALISAIENGSDLSVRNATETTINKDALVWTYHEGGDSTTSPFKTENPYFVVSLNQDDSTLSAQQKSIQINIELQNIGDGTVADCWQPIDNAGQNYTFYYTNDLQSGATSNSLVKQVQLDTNLKEGAYVAFDFDLDVNLDSIQIVKDTDNVESAASITSGWSVATGISATNATPTATNSAKEISVIKWTKTAT